MLQKSWTFELEAAHPPIGRPAPQFALMSTHGEIKLSDYRGSWVVLMSHPFEICPETRWDKPIFDLLYQKLRSMNAELIGVGGDDTLTSLVWCENAREELGLKVSFPVIADTDYALAKLYGILVVKNGTAFLNHAMYIIDDAQILRAIIYYDPNSHDVLHHLVHLLDLLQKTNLNGIVAHEFWQHDWTLLSEADMEKLHRCPVHHGKNGMWYS